MTAVDAMTIVMADDDPDDRLMTHEAFRDSGVPGTLHFVHDGEELMDYLRHRGAWTGSPHRLPALVLLDLNMPRKDGREALREIRADAALRHLPVVVLTTSRVEEDAVRALADGASSFATKPAGHAAMVALVRGLAAQWRGG